MGDYNASFWRPEQNKIEKLRKQSTPNVHTYHCKEYGTKLCKSYGRGCGYYSKINQDIADI